MSDKLLLFLIRQTVEVITPLLDEFIMQGGLFKVVSVIGTTFQ
jgi:hypothetical protein